MKKLSLIPQVISSWRLAALPLFFYFYNQGNIIACLILLASSAATDFFDGYLARKLKADSRFGAYYDAGTDFVLMLGIFTFFTAKGFYPVWLVILITISFLQFLISSVYSKKLYDPVGRYIGSALYIGVVLTLIFPSQATFSFVQYAFIAFFVISIASRIISLAKRS
jgi:phosphatidylglycerophosphate synthase